MPRIAPNSRQGQLSRTVFERKSKSSCRRQNWRYESPGLLLVYAFLSFIVVTSYLDSSTLSKERLFSVQLYFRYESAAKCHRNFPCQFLWHPPPRKQSIQNLSNKLKAARKKKPDREPTVLAEDKLYAIRARLETSVRKSPKRPAQQTSVSNTSARRNTKFYICSSVHRNSRLKKSNNMRQYADIYLPLITLHVSGAHRAHHQEYIKL